MCKVTDRRTKADFAYRIKDLLPVYYLNAAKATIVMDNLNTHNPSSLYEAFEPVEAKSLLDRCDLHYTPKHGSWLNLAEIEFSDLQRQCLERRLPDQEMLREEIAAWEDGRNAQQVTVHWRFTMADAWIRLKRLYLSIKN
ncbi:MAG: transposase (plasmid) [Candidatus Entotheonella factor]|uniref:Transposase n=2 Tax=Bacteria TaxID=2 RepID=W4M0W1_ENTF1